MVERKITSQGNCHLGPAFVELVEMREKLPPGGDTRIKNNLRPGVRRGEGGGSWSSTELGSTSCLSSKSLVWKVAWTWFWEAYGWLPFADADPTSDELSPELVSLWLHLEQGLVDMILKFEKDTSGLHVTHKVEVWPFYLEWVTRIFCDGITEGH